MWAPVGSVFAPGSCAHRGHEVGNHTWHHRNAWFLGPRATEEEMVGGAGVLAGIGLGSLAPGKAADVQVMSPELYTQQVFIGGEAYAGR